MKRFVQYSFLITACALLVACASTVNETGKEFDFKKGINIQVDRSLKKEIINNYGEPTSTSIVGKYQILKYHYSRESVKHGRAIGLGALSAVTYGASDMFVDHGVKKSDMQVEYKQLVVYADLISGVVKDYYYHDSDLNGHDESETLYLKAANATKQGGQTAQARSMLEQAISLNPRNHRALNTLAWMLIDNNDDVDRGIELAKRAVEIFPDSPFNNGTLGIGYMKKNDLDNAEKYLDTAVKLFPIYAPSASKAYNHDVAFLKTVRELKKGKASS